MRVLLAVHAFPPRSTAGVEVYTLRLARALASLGHEVLVLAAAHDLSAKPYSAGRRLHEGVEVVEIVSVHSRGTLEATYEDPEIDRAAAAILAEFRPDCVHIQHLLNLSAGIIPLARQLGAAVVWTLHDHWLSCPRDGLRMRADLALCGSMDHGVCAACLRDSPYLVPPLERGLAGAARRAGLGRRLHRLHDLVPRATETAMRLMRRLSRGGEDLAQAMDERAARLRARLEDVDLLLAPTGFVKERALEFGAPAAGIQVLPLGAVLGPTRPRHAGPRPRVGFIGTLAPQKGVHVLIEAFRGLTRRDASLDLFGSPTLHPSYVRSLRRAADGDARIRFRGAFAEGEQERVLSELDVLALPSVWWETTGLTALEALAAGVPVVASRIGGVPEVVPTEAGLLVPPGDARALGEALRDVVDGRRLDGELPPLPLKTVAEGARELAALYASLRAPRAACRA